ncbi:exonuclease SbcCD subunit D C-terminal domain-containing protein [Psychrobacter pygoscelis]|uniref:exonuclease SbcCD subunit D C-terminal domain-containing protein n=1 Tax=Psychrobacter pygoscelis TaxID=2488563 RepID=UPI00103FED3F|nr:exonuclease SbcCD subunit D C-terminal domain-containing protein [Psychrobacter pygoscelis]
MANPIAPPTPLTILHTSDWHLGRKLYGKNRYEEFAAFLSWLTETIVQHNVDVLIVAGDIFDVMTPTNKAQALYYEFLAQVTKSCCQHIVIVAGNHDSPSFLDAPSQFLKHLNVHVIGTACEDIANEVLTLMTKDGTPYCIITAVPYLRDRDVRGSVAGESADDKDSNVLKGIRAHYDEAAAIAKAKQDALVKTHGRHIPIIATGHLFAAGGRTTEDDGVRELYVGSLGQVSDDMFDDCFDYVALGHLHVPQRVGGCEHIRYSGSPLAMGFGEARQQKQVLLVQFGETLTDFTSANKGVDNSNIAPLEPRVAEEDLIPDVAIKQPKKVAHNSEFMDDLFGFTEVTESENDDAKNTSIDNVTDMVTTTKVATTVATPIDNTLPTIKVVHQDDSRYMQVVSLPIPCFQPLAQVSGDLATITTTLQSLATTETMWLEVIYSGDEIVTNLRELVQSLIEGLPFEVLKIKNTRTYDKVMQQQESTETLQDLDELEVFQRCLNAHAVAESQRDSLQAAYEEILYTIRHADSQAE